jgi:hypothetical protein
MFAENTKKLAKEIGPPAYLVTDGAVELIDSADTLEIEGKTPVVLRDMKHYAANVLEQLLGKDERFQQYLSKLRNWPKANEPGCRRRI